MRGRRHNPGGVEKIAPGATMDTWWQVEEQYREIYAGILREIQSKVWSLRKGPIAARSVEHPGLRYAAIGSLYRDVLALAFVAKVIGNRLYVPYQRLNIGTMSGRRASLSFDDLQHEYEAAAKAVESWSSALGRFHERPEIIAWDATHPPDDKGADQSLTNLANESTKLQAALAQSGTLTGPFDLLQAIRDYARFLGAGFLADHLKTALPLEVAKLEREAAKAEKLARGGLSPAGRRKRR